MLRTSRALSHMLAAFAAGLILFACTPPAPSPEELQAEVQAFVDGYQDRYVELYTESSKAQWASNTHIVEGDDSNRQREEAAAKALTEFTGAVETLEKVQAYLEQKDQLQPVQVRALERMLYVGGEYPGTVPEIVDQRIAAEALQNEKLFGFEFKLDGEPVSANQIDDILDAESDLGARQAAWEASKEVGVELRQGLAELADLRNQTVQSLGYDHFFAHQVSAYGMTSEEMINLLEQLVRDLWPLYRELHTYTRYELAAQYGAEVPEMLPAHWLPNRWGQDWSSNITVEGLDINAALADKSPEWVIEQAEQFYISLGFPPLPQSFWDKSSLYPAPEDAEYKKNNHASAWHVDLQDDVRSLMSVQANERWWGTTHHELGHIYYYIAYSNPNVPPILRRGANRGFHEAVGTQLGMASKHKAFLIDRGLVDADAEVDEVRQLLKEALDTVVFIPFSAGTMSHFEYDLYRGAISPENYNQAWWNHVAHFQGIVPPSERGETYCDAATKTHINNDPAQYYDYALSHVILHQLHAHIARNILHQDERNTNYFGREDVGAFLRSILELGATQDWRQVMRDHLGEELSAKAMLDYYSPLMDYLKQANEGRTHTLPETI